MLQLPVKQRKVVVGWVSRPRSKYNSRAVINEADVVAALAKHYGQAADVRLLHFNRSLTAAMQDVADVDVMVGVHGAGQPWHYLACRVTGGEPISLHCQELGRQHRGPAVQGLWLHGLVRMRADC